MTLDDHEWAAAALRRAGRSAAPAAVAEVVDRLKTAPGRHRLESADIDIDTDAALHRRTHMHVLSAAGFDQVLAQALYDTESDPALNPFAADAAACLRSLAEAGVPVAVLSDIHVDIRPAFDRAGLATYVDAFALSFEHGVCKPDPRIFAIALERLGAEPDEALMVGDRPGHDGGAVQVGMPTLLLAPLRSIEDRRLHLVQALLSPAC